MPAHSARTIARRRWRRLSAALLVGAALLPCWVGCDRKPADGEVRVVRLWAHQGQEKENAAMRAIADAFNAEHAAQKLRVEITFYPDRQYADKVSIAAFSKTLPDVLDVDGPYVGPWAAEGILQPLDELIDETLRADLLSSLIEQGTYADHLYAVGAFDSALVVYYNADVIERAGLHPPEHVAEAWTWDEFVQALEQVKPLATVPLSLHMDDASSEWFTYAFSPLLWSNGGQLIDDGRAVGVLDSPANIAALTRWQQLFRDGLAEPTSTNPDPFSAGLAAFDWTGHWMLPRFEQKEGLRFGVMPLPKMGERFVAASGSWCWGISRDCGDRAAAWQVISWLLDPEHGIKPIVQANGAVPGRRSAFALFPEYEELPRQLFREQLEQAARARPRTPAYLTLTSEFAAALRDVARGTDVARRLKEAAENVQRTLDRRGGDG
ncbi:MAG: sugar ABC transporter substrate-binding protein [Phycisphaerae bacterium]|jgi:multiple sugar transport system substrate-binding protein